MFTHIVGRRVLIFKYLIGASECCLQQCFDLLISRGLAHPGNKFPLSHKAFAFYPLEPHKSLLLFIYSPTDAFISTPPCLFHFKVHFGLINSIVKEKSWRSTLLTMRKNNLCCFSFSHFLKISLSSSKAGLILRCLTAEDSIKCKTAIHLLRTTLRGSD